MAPSDYPTEMESQPLQHQTADAQQGDDYADSPTSQASSNWSSSTLPKWIGSPKKSQQWRKYLPFSSPDSTYIDEKHPQTSQPSLWPSALQVIVYLLASTLIGYACWTLGAKFEHQHDLLMAYSSGVPGLVGEESLPEVHTSISDNEINPVKQHKLAFATFLSAWSPDNQDHANSSDWYYLQTRILTYQFLYDPVTKTDPDIPFLVLTMPEVEEWKKEQLRKDGATVVPIDRVDTKKGPHKGRWKDVISKFEVFTLTDYDKICLLDADTTLVAPLTSIFSDPAARIRTTGSNSTALHEDESPLPSEYLMAAKSEESGHLSNHIKSPPRHPHASRAIDPTFSDADWSSGASSLATRTNNPNSPDYFNAGFMVLKPSMEVYEYYLSILNTSGRFNPIFPEQNLWNYAHRREGNMPWTTLKWDWNVHGPRDDDLAFGVKSLHGRLWILGGEWTGKAGSGLGDPRYEFWAEKREMMERYFGWREQVEGEEIAEGGRGVEGSSEEEVEEVQVEEGGKRMAEKEDEDDEKKDEDDDDVHDDDEEVVTFKIEAGRR